ncbi:MAG: zinc ribbon domain-containing protein [Deltaproteobacteria bacterium]|nr:zinc ribbon domain-containing protein [Deltaproteobacteria bacterium]
MRCPKCGFENREGAQFCLKCGEKLALRCFECGNLLPLSAKFCDRCGYGSELPAYSAQGPGLKRGAASPVPPAGFRFCGSLLRCLVDLSFRFLFLS